MHRRSFLKSAATWSLLSPLMFAGQRAYGRANGPRRVIVLFSPNGPQFEVGPTTAESTEASPILHPWWAPLQRHIGRGTFFRDCHQLGSAFGSPAEYGHHSGAIGALTGTVNPDANIALGPSLDQFIGQKLQASGVVTPQRSLLWGLYSGEHSYHSFYESSGVKVGPIEHPFAALQQLAPSFGNDQASVQRAALKRKHFALDSMLADCKRLRGQLDGLGREQLDFHCANIESLELSVASALQPKGEMCQMPEAGPLADLDAMAEFGVEGRDAAFEAFRQMMALALVCDVTRVIGFGFAPGAARFQIPASYGVPASGVVDSGDSGAQMHAWTHQPKDLPGTLDAMKIFYTWFSEKVASLLDILVETKDADGLPLIDSTLVLWASEYGAGGPHTNDRVPLVVFGDGCGQFKTGRQFRPEDPGGPKTDRALPLHQLYVSIARHAGLADVDTFGAAGQGPLDWLSG